MHLTSFTDYGLRTLMYVAAHPEKTASVKEIAGHYGISRNHLVKVVHRLAQLGYVETSKGRGGGIRLSENAEKLRLGDMISALEPDLNMVECFDPETNTCRITDSCQLKHYLFEATRSFIDTMNRHTLGDAVARSPLDLRNT